jgi:hypothetical protein
MIAGFGAVCVIFGAAVAYRADSFPRHQSIMELVAGCLLIGGFGLLGYALSHLGHAGLRTGLSGCRL